MVIDGSFPLTGGVWGGEDVRPKQDLQIFQNTAQRYGSLLGGSTRKPLVALYIDKSRGSMLTTHIMLLLFFFTDKVDVVDTPSPLLTISNNSVGLHFSFCLCFFENPVNNGVSPKAG